MLFLANLASPSNPSGSGAATPSSIVPKETAVTGGFIDALSSPQTVANIAEIVAMLWPIVMAITAVADEEPPFRDEIAHFSLKKIVKKVGKAIKPVLKSGLVKAAVAAIPGAGPLVSTAMTLASAASASSAPKVATPIVAQPVASPPLTYQIPANEIPVAVVGQPGSVAKIFPQTVPTVVKQATLDFIEVAKLQGGYAALEMLQNSYPEIFALLVEVANYAKKSKDSWGETTGYLHERKQYWRDQSTMCEPCGVRVGSFNGNLRQGTFYKGGLVTASLRNDLGYGVYGEVNLSRLPFPISVSSSNNDARARIALTHELAHVADRVYKLGLTHDQVHQVGIFYATEGLPMLEAYRKFTGNS